MQSDEKIRFAQRTVRGIHETKQRVRLSPSVINRAEELQKLRPESHKGGGLRDTQAALNIAKRKMAKEHYDSEPEQAVEKEIVEDGKETVQTMGNFVKRSISARMGQLRNRNAPIVPSSVQHSTAIREKHNAARVIRRERIKNAIRKETQKAAARTAKNNAIKGTAKAAKRAAAVTRKSMFSFAKIAALPVMLIVLAILFVIIMIAMLVSVLSSPPGMFFSTNEDNPNQVSRIIQDVEGEWFAEIKNMRKEYEAQGYIVEVNYGANTGDMGGRVDNWRDVLALYAVTRDVDKQSMAGFSTDDVQEVRELFFQMNSITVETHIGKDADGKDVMIADIGIINKRYIQMSGEYPLSEEQQSMIAFLMSSENTPLWQQLGIGSVGGGFDGDLNIVISKLPPGTLGSEIVKAAFTRLGDPYSMELRGQGNYVDCSGLTMWAYAQAGVAIPWTAADQGKYCVENNKVIDESQLLPGDLIFWSYPNSSRVKDRFMAIGHVAIYAGDGMMVEAAPSAGGVVYREVSVQGTPILYARPHV